MASASSSSTSATTASQQHSKHQTLDSTMRTRHVLGSVIRSSSTTRSNPIFPPSRASPQFNRASPQSSHSHSRTQGSKGAESTEAAEPLPSSFLYNKTWNIHKTTPFFNYNKHQQTQYEGELLTYIAANARNFISSALTGHSQTGGAAATITNRTGGAFPGQIDSSGNNLVETLDELGDIRGIKFQSLNTSDVQDSDEERTGEVADTDSIVVTVTVRPKGRTRDQAYYCVIVPDQRHRKASQAQAFTHFGVILFKAPVMIAQLVNQWLERRFDCRICHLVFQMFELRKIVESALEVSYNHPQGHDHGKERPVELCYSLPQAVVGLKTISVSLAADDVRQLFVSRVEDSETGILDGIEAHCSDSMKIDFSRLVLSRAGCSSWYIASEGKIKVFPDIATRYSLADFIQAITVCGT